MKKIFVTMLAAVIALSAVAQKEKSAKQNNGKHKGAEMGQHKGDEMGKHKGHEMGQRGGPEAARRQGMIGGIGKLNLSDAQKAQMKTVNENHRQQMQELNKNESITVREQKERREALAKQHRADVQNILTAEQRAQLEQDKKEYKDKSAKGNMGRGGEMKGGDRVDNLKQLNLSNDQGARIKAVNEEFRTRMQAIQKNTSLSNDQKKAQRDAAQQQHTAAIKAILTVEQRNKLETLKSERPDRRGKK